MLRFPTTNLPAQIWLDLRSRFFETHWQGLACVLLALLALCCVPKANADMTAITPTISYTDNSPFPIKIGTQMLFVEDPKHTLSKDTVLNNSDIPWREVEKASPNFGFTDSAFWFRFNLFNQEAEEKEVFFELPIPFLDHIEFYHLSDKNVLQEYYVGDERPFNERPIRHQNYVMPFDIKPGENTFLVRVASAGTIEAPLFVWNPKSFLVADGNERLLQGIWFGVLGIMVIYNLFLLGLLKDVSYLHYVCFAFSYLMFQGALKGYGFAYLWPNQLEWNSYAISVFIAASNFFAFMLVIHFLDLAKHSKKAFKVTSAIAALCGALLILTFVLPYGYTVRVNSAMSMVTCVWALILGYWSWFNGNPLAKYFCLAWTSAFGGVGILVATKFGVFPSNLWTNNAGQIGVMAQVALLSFALASRFNREKEKRLKAQEKSLHNERLARRSQDELLRAKAHANTKLEQEVAERTENLQQALSQLETFNEKLEHMSKTDALTELFNRRHFEEIFAEEFKRSMRHRRQLSIILCDIDHFKAVNDLNGHQAGDECLKSVAALFKQRINRSGDLVARYGGEEFIILLGDTSMSQAQCIARDLRESLERMDFRFNNKSIPLTASFGIASLDSTKIESADQLVTQADMALYHAKDNGRNQVICWSEMDSDEGDVPELNRA